MIKNKILNPLFSWAPPHPLTLTFHAGLHGDVVIEEGGGGACLGHLNHVVNQVVGSLGGVEEQRQDGHSISSFLRRVTSLEGGGEWEGKW